MIGSIDFTFFSRSSAEPSAEKSPQKLKAKVPDLSYKAVKIVNTLKPLLYDGDGVSFVKKALYFLHVLWCSFIFAEQNSLMRPQFFSYSYFVELYSLHFLFFLT